jgi:hypothetical protein
MIAKVREILLTQYIGAILVACIGCHAAIAFVGVIVRDAAWYIAQQRYRSVFGRSTVPFPWENLIFTVINIVLYLLLAYFLARWLYPRASSTAVPSEGEQP